MVDLTADDDDEENEDRSQRTHDTISLEDESDSDVTPERKIKMEELKKEPLPLSRWV